MPSDDLYSPGHNSYSSPVTAFMVKRETRLAVNASPEPVRKGQRLAVRGKLTRLSSSNTLVPFAGKRVGLNFRPDGGSYRFVKSATTNRYGRVTSLVTAREDGTWALRYRGSASYAPSGRGDHVDVR